MQLQPTTESQASQLNIRPSFAGFKIPYFDIKGKMLPFFRYRFLQDRPTRGFASLVEPAKARKYTQPAGTAPDVYLPPLLNGGNSWAKVAKSDEPLIITEGELKAACGCAHGIPVIGLGGVWNFQSARLGLMLLPSITAFQLERNIYICYDSDSNNGTKADVQQAQYRLAAQLTAHGAHVFHIDLPPIDGAKVGMDDYIVSQGMESFLALVSEAKEMVYSAELHKMNDEVAYIRSSQEIIEIATANIMTADKFTNVAYKPRKYYEQVGDANKLRYTAKEWMECEYRNEVARLTYNPGEPLITEAREYNLWRPTNLVPTRGSIQPWEIQLNRVLQGAKAADILWLKRWFAAPLKWPGTKLHSSVLIWGAQGVGKGILGVTMKRLYGDNFHKTSDEVLFGRFSYWAHRHSFIMVDEIEPKTKFEVSNKLKDMITRDDITIELKMAAPYTTRDCLNYYFTSNKENAIQLDPDDRRFFVHQTAVESMTEADATAYFRWLDEEGGASHLLHYFLYDLDMGSFQPKDRPPVTDSKSALIEASMSELDYVCARMYADRGTEIPRHWAKRHLWTTKEILSVLDPEGKKRITANHLSRCLRKAGFKLVANGLNNVIVNGVRERVWALCHEPMCERLGPADAAAKHNEEWQEKYAIGGKSAAEKKPTVN